MDPFQLKQFLDARVEQYNRIAFIAGDPISIPHVFSVKQDIEIAGLFSAIFSWGQRTTIIRKGMELMALMDHDPYNFIRHHREKDLSAFLFFKHRTFNATDVLYFIHFLNNYYSKTDSLEDLFDPGPMETDIGNGLIRFHQTFFSLPEAPFRTKKHISTPANGSACKRLNMFLRWMVRKDNHGVDFGIWNRIKASQLICPCDLHVGRVARKLGLVTRKQNDWKTALELTGNLRLLDREDPVKYDYALFNLGVIEKF